MNQPVCVVCGIGPKNGASFARRFAGQGYAVALLSRKSELATEIAATLPNAQSFVCDVSDPSSVEAAFAAVRQQLGEVDVLVFNAGSGPWGNIEELSAEDFERSWRVNTLGTFLTSK